MEIEYIILGVVIALIIILITLNGYMHDRKEHKKFIKRLYGEYGILSPKEYKPGEFEKISHYFLKHHTGFHIDDITWNDLSMDEIFKRINYTYSAAGEEYLYHTLRTPVMEPQSLKEKEAAISFFREHTDERVACQFIFSQLGKIGKFSIYDYLDYLDDLGNRRNTKHYLAFAGMLAAIAALFINVPLGMLALACVLSFNIIMYFKVKNEIEPYITSFAYIFRLLNTVVSIQKIKAPVLEKEMKELKNAYASMGGFKRGSFWLMSPSRMSGSGNPLEIILDYLRITFHLDLIQFNKMLSEVRKHTSEIDRMLTLIGQIETMIAIGEFREGIKEFCIPDFVEDKILRAVSFYHPLIKEPVKSDIFTDSSILITGSNASGKSTFLKTIALNGILAQTIHTCLAESYRTGMFRIYSSMSLKDDLMGGDSYYMVELKALKRIMDELKKEGLPVLCFVDEVLRGTNTVERIAASTQILRSMNQKRGMCFAATHDIELTHLLEGDYDNYHFEDEIQANDIFFSYKIITGRATTRNAIKLLGIMGYEEDIIREAELVASDFLKTGSWKKLDSVTAQ